jgi:hypothetical protein
LSTNLRNDEDRSVDLAPEIETRKLAKWGLRVALLLVAALTLYVAILVFPSPLFAHVKHYDGYRVFSDEPVADDFDAVIEDLDVRLRAMEHAAPRKSQRIYLCSPKKYAFFSFLLRMNPRALAMGLSVANESFVSVERVRQFAELNRGVLRHTRFEGNVAEVVAHEIAHFNSVHALGYRPHLRQPVWKSEGWAEYQANLAPIKTDPDYDLRRRIDVLEDQSYWSGRHAVARSLWESQLLVEFLGEVKGYRLQDIVQNNVTEDGTRDEMMAWWRGSSGGARVLALPALPYDPYQQQHVQQSRAEVADAGDQ